MVFIKLHNLQPKGTQWWKLSFHIQYTYYTESFGAISTLFQSILSNLPKHLLSTGHNWLLFNCLYYE